MSRQNCRAGPWSSSWIEDGLGLLLKGSWGLATGVISKVTILITTYVACDVLPPTNIIDGASSSLQNNGSARSLQTGERYDPIPKGSMYPYSRYL